MARNRREPRGKELISKYKSEIQVSDSLILTEEMILRHWELEKKLTAELLKSTPETRWDVFEECYTTLYKELPWLNQLSGCDRRPAREEVYSDWISVIGLPPKTVYEIGSGNGALINFLASRGHYCTGTEITRERGGKTNSENTGVKWDVSDGVHLEKFEQSNTYDVVISDQVIEHLHPDDLVEHFKGAYAILKPGGSYILRTPHCCLGPFGISRVFNYECPIGMHLREYTFVEISRALKSIGYSSIEAIFSIPYTIRGFVRVNTAPRPSSAYLRYLSFVERTLVSIPHQQMRYWTSFILSGLLLFKPDIFMKATK